MVRQNCCLAVLIHRIHGPRGRLLLGGGGRGVKSRPGVRGRRLAPSVVTSRAGRLGQAGLRIAAIVWNTTTMAAARGGRFGDLHASLLAATYQPACDVKGGNAELSTRTRPGLGRHRYKRVSASRPRAPQRALSRRGGGRHRVLSSGEVLPLRHTGPQILKGAVLTEHAVASVVGLRRFVLGVHPYSFCA